MFRDFMQREGRLSEEIHSQRQFKRIDGRYQLMLCGSDQIWNPLLTFGLAKPYFLKFPMLNCRRISYAASIGGSARDRGKMLSYIRDLDAVSIREKTDWLEGVEGLRVERHIDPTLLLAPEAWRAMARQPEGREKYILVYCMQGNAGAYDIVEALKRRTGLKVYDISRYGYQPACVDRSFVDVGPEEFAGLFSAAEHVCTNSFHGLVFSLIFNKTVDFIPIRRFGGRIDYLCALFHLKKVSEGNGAYYHMEYDVGEKDRIHSPNLHSEQSSLFYRAECLSFFSAFMVSQCNFICADCILAGGEVEC